jgi:hypothetical protein
MILHPSAARLAATSSRRVRPLRRNLLLRCQVVRERDFRLIGRQAIDLSIDGMLVSSDLPVLTGEPVIVSFAVPFGRRWVDAEATVARVVHGRRRGDRGTAMGLSFDYVEADARAALEEQLRWFKPASAAAFGRAALR